MSPELRLVFELRQGDAAPVTLTAWIGPDYFDLIEGGHETLYDFKLRRRLVLDRTAGTFANLSLYGDVAFRRFDMEKRVELAGMFSAGAGGKEQPLALKPFWIESDVGVPTGLTPRTVVAQETVADGSLRFRVNGEEVGLFVPKPGRLPLRIGQTFARFLRYRLQLHPDIVGALEEDGRLPQRLIFVVVAGEDRRPGGLVLRKSEMVNDDYPLPATLRSVPIPAGADDTDASTLRALLPVMLDAVAGKWGNGPRSLADYRRAIDEALQHKQGFQAALLLAEMTMQYGRAANDCTTGPPDVPCHDADELSKRLAGDARAAKLYKAQLLQSKDPKQALALWQGLRRDDVTDGYVVDIFLAGLESAGNRADAAVEFVRGMRGNPYLGALYKDLGDYFLRGARVDLAWLCYDLGRSLPGGGRTGPLTSVDGLELRLAQAYSNFF